MYIGTVHVRVGNLFIVSKMQYNVSMHIVFIHEYKIVFKYNFIMPVAQYYM